MALNLKGKHIFSFIFQMLIVSSLIFILLPTNNLEPVASAKQYLPLEGEGWGVFVKPEGETGVEIAKSTIARIIDNIRYIIGAIAILMILISAVKLISAEGNEETLTKQRGNILNAIIGLVIVGLAGDISQIFTVEEGGFLRDPSKMFKQIRIFNRTIEIIITFIKYLIGGIAVLTLVGNGLSLIMGGGNEEEVSKRKKDIGWAIGGLLFILLATPLVNEVFYKIDFSKYPGMETVRPAIDMVRGLREIVGVTNLIVTFVAPFAILSLIGGGIFYMTAGDNEENASKAKKIIMWALIGIIVIYGAFGIVSTFIARKFEGI